MSIEIDHFKIVESNAILDSLCMNRYSHACLKGGSYWKTSSLSLEIIHTMSTKKELEDSMFVVDEINLIIKDSIDEAIGSSQFQHDRVTHWSNAVGEACTKRLITLAKPFKYIATTIIMQKTGAGMVMATSSHWDKGSDGTRTIRWENKTMYVIVTIFGVSAWKERDLNIWSFDCSYKVYTW